MNENTIKKEISEMSSDAVTLLEEQLVLEGGGAELYAAAAASSSCGIGICKPSNYALVGKTIQLTATVTPECKSVTWSSSNKSVADVNSCGLVTIKNVGQTTITACACGNCSASTTIYGVLEDGMYNLQNSGNYLNATVDQWKVFETSGVYQYTASNTNQSQMWKVRYLADGQYSIRSYMNDRMGLAVLDATNEAGITSISTNDTTCSVLSKARWTITADSSGYTLKNVSTGKVLAVLSGSPGNYLRLQTVSYESGGSKTNQRWKFNKPASVPEELVVFDLERHIYLNNNSTISLNIGEVYNTRAAYRSSKSANQSITWSSNDENNAIANTVGGIAGRKAGTVTITIKHNSSGLSRSFKAKVNKNAIIIIPGIMGSELVSNSLFSYVDCLTLTRTIYQKGTKFWAPIENNASLFEKTSALLKIKALECNFDGDSKYDIVLHNDDNWGALDQYKTLYQHLYKEFNDKYIIDFFAYDWRASNEESAEQLNRYINKQQYDQIVIIAHSMGGLVASHYLNLGTAQRNKVQTFISLGTPYFGSLDILETYINHSIPMINKWYEQLAVEFSKAVDIVIPNLPSVYQLFPTEQYFSIAKKAYLYDSKEPVTSSFQIDLLLSSHLESFNYILYKNAKSANESLYSHGKHITQLVNSFYIVGYEIDTSDRLEIQGKNFTSSGNNGDGTVPVWSADLGGMYPKNTYYAYKRNHTGGMKNGKVSSEGLIVSDNVLTLVKELIKGNAIINLSGITQTRPY